jgi:outer membrane protein assembly factor BamA
VGGSLEATLPVVDSTGDCFRQVLNSSTLSSTVGIVYDGRSNPLNPITGVRYSTTYSYGNKELRGPVACLDSATPTSDGRQRIELDLETYLPLFGSVVLADGLHFGQVSGNLLDENDLFYFGGQSTVRGLRENLIRASRRFWGTVETRLLLAENSYAAAFFDGGFYAVPELRGIAASEAWTYGYGVGAQIETPLGLARISFALGKGDSFDTGKVFIGLINQF